MNAPGEYGDYSYPIKLYEAMACGRPVVASRTAWALRDFPDRLAAPGDAAALAGALVSALDLGAVDYGPQPGWTVSGAVVGARLAGRCRWQAAMQGNRAAQPRSHSASRLPQR